MRTFHHLKLISDIVENPHETIGQRNYNLFRVYLSPFTYYTEVKYDSKIESQLLKIPSIEVFIAKEFGQTHTRTVQFDYYIDAIAEDEREKFNICIDRIYKYESTFPLPISEYTFKLKDISYHLDLKNELMQILPRPNMYGIINFSLLSDSRKVYASNIVLLKPSN
ncbi:MAG: hypothetical protein HYZ42_04440 [Bacteroidetes bacterium]|nr:hypothetical protein [Bacteroidota bacterium]